jgi:protein LTV1
MLRVLIADSTTDSLHSDKKTATHFTLVHRPQNDPLIHDEDAPQMVLNPTNPTKKPTGKGAGLDDLASQLGSEISSIRDNEGEAASYGVYFDDTEYDYMQHMRDLGSGGGDVVFVEADSTGTNKGKGKQKKVALEDALRQLDLEQTAGDLLDDEILPSKHLQQLPYDAHQNVPDAIAGFQPDMDPRLREVLEALEDDEYVDEEGDDIFKELSKNPREVDEYEFEETAFDDDDGWESDHTAKPTTEYQDDEVNEADEEADQVPELPGATGAEPSQDWMEEFKQFKKDQRVGAPRGVTGSVLESAWTTTTNGGRTKKRKGALTNPSTYSMTSSSLVRTEQLGILDDRYEKLEERYQSDITDVGSVSAVSTASTVQGPLRGDFDNVMDEFLSGYSKGRRPSKKSGVVRTGLDQLDEIRQGVGEPILPKGMRRTGKKAA